MLSVSNGSGIFARTGLAPAVRSSARTGNPNVVDSSAIPARATFMLTRTVPAASHPRVNYDTG